VFNSLKGVITEKTSGKVRIETGGVEWELEVSYATLSGLPHAGSPARIFTHHLHREDSMRRFGFAKEEERMLFLDLLKVDGIGPKQAIRILSGANVDSFAEILEAGDVDSLKRIPGIGVKSAQKIILALKGKLTLKEAEEAEEGRDLVTALADMGFDRRKAAAVVASLLEETREEGIAGEKLEQEIFRRAIVRLSS